MKTAIISTLVISTILRLLTCVIFYGPRNNILAQIGGPGLFTAIRAATVDPIHTWDHLEESCFWRENAPSPWISMGEKGGEDGLRVDNPSTTGHYGDIYTPGTRIVLPPLVFAFLGETLVCPGGVTTDVPKLLLWILQRLLLLVADGIGAWAIYQVGKRIIHMDELSDEEDMERQTQQSEMNDERNDGKLVVPGMLRPEMGWIFGLSTKIINQEHIFKTDGDNKTTIENDIKNDANNNVDGNGVNQKQQNNNHRTTSNEVSVNKDSNQKAQKIPKELILTPQQLPLIAALFYFINPIAMIANAIGSLRGVWDALFLLSLHYAVTSPVKMTKEGIPTKIPSASKSAFCLALATYVDVAYGMFILPILLWRGILPARQAKKIQRDLHRDWKSFICLYAFHLICLHILAFVLVGGDWTTYRKVMLRTILPNVAFLEQDESGSVPGPSMGLHWYFFVQMFDRFRPYFSIFVSGIPAMLPIPLMTRLHRYPSALVTSFQLLWAIFRPIATVHTLSLALQLALLNPRTIVRMGNPSIISLFALPVPILLFMTFHRMWLVTGNGNPNYIYFQCIAYCVFVSLIVVDFVSATVKRDKVRRMVEKGDTVKKTAIKNQEEELKQEEIEVEKEQVVEENDCDKGLEEETKESDAEQSEDADEKPEPMVVFL